MANPSNHIAAAAASLALVGAFGAGAFALNQGDGEFDPAKFANAYAQGMNDSKEGYQANPSDADAQANRHDDGTDEQNQGDSSKEDKSQNNIPIEGASGTTALRVSDSGSTESGLVAGSGNGDGSQEGTGNGATGPALEPDEKGNGGNADNSNNNGSDNGNNGGNGDSNGNDQPSTDSDPSYKVLPNDPEPSKNSMGGSFIDVIPAKNDGTTAGYADDDIYVNISPDNNNPFGYQIYKGQTIDAWSLFCVISATYTVGKGEDAKMYEWICDSKEEFAKYDYFRIETNYKKAPNEPFTIKVYYRFNSTSKSWHEQDVTIVPQDSCVFLVGNNLDENGNRKVIKQVYGTETINLFRYSEEALKSLGAINDSGNSSTLILNWKENGETVDSLYTPAPGRHAIEIGDTIPVPDGCTVSCTDRYVGDYLYSLQLLNSVDSSSPLYQTDEDDNVVLTVPDGIQAIDSSQSWGGMIYADKLIIPSSVIYINEDDDSLDVESRYEVAQDNPIYSATDSGILTNKEGTQYLGLPRSLADLTVPAGITKVCLSYNQWNLDRVVLEAETADQLPEISWGYKSLTNIVVNDSLLGEFAKANADSLYEDSGNTVSPASDPTEQYFCDGNLIRSGSELFGVLPDGTQTVTLSDPISWKSNCFSNSSITTIIIPANYDLNLENGCLDNSAVKQIKCISESQKTYLDQFLSDNGIEGIDVSLMNTSQEGYSYYVVDGEVTLLDAPAGVEEFTGIIHDQNGEELKVTTLGDDLFANSKSLKWAILDESVTNIGARAFNSCPNLQGIFISNEDSITVGADAYTNCDNMRFVASRAMNATFESYDTPSDPYCMLWCRTYAMGYPNYNYFYSNVDDYNLVKTCEGNYALYAYSDNFDEDLNRKVGNFLLLSTGSSIPEGSKVSLDPDTQEIFTGAFKGIESSYTINWEDLTVLAFINDDVFSAAGTGTNGLTGDVVMCGQWDNARIYDGPFAYSNIKSFTSTAKYLSFGNYAFNFSKNLETVSIAAGKSDDPENSPSFMPYEIFNDCSSLKTIKFTNPDPMEIGISNTSKKSPFRFNGSLSIDEETAAIHLDIPEEYWNNYIQAWTYRFTGYIDYDGMYSLTYKRLYAANGYTKEPTEAEVRDAMKVELLEGENRLRAMMGAPTVTETTVVLPDATGNNKPTVNPDNTDDADQTTEADEAAADENASLDESAKEEAPGSESSNSSDGSADSKSSDEAVKPDAPSDNPSSGAADANSTAGTNDVRNEQDKTASNAAEGLSSPSSANPVA